MGKGAADDGEARKHEQNGKADMGYGEDGPVGEAVERIGDENGLAVARLSAWTAPNRIAAPMAKNIALALPPATSPRPWLMLPRASAEWRAASASASVCRVRTGFSAHHGSVACSTPR